MNPAWAVVVLVGVATIAIKAAGPVLLGGRPLPPRVAGLIVLLRARRLGRRWRRRARLPTAQSHRIAHD